MDSVNLSEYSTGYWMWLRTVYKQIDFDKGVILMMMAGPFSRLPNPWTFLLIDLYIIGLFSCVILLPVPFIFRYFTVCRNKILTGWQYAALIAICYLITFLYTGLHSWAFWPSDYKDRYAYIIDHEFWKDDDGNLPYFVASDIKERRIIVLVFFTMLFGMISYAFVICFNVCIMRVLGRNAHIMSKKTQAMQKQLGNVFKYQALVPFIICVMPLTFVFVLCALGVRTAGKGSILTMIVGWIPVANPFSTIFFIRHYRRVVLRKTPFKKCFKKQIEDGTTGKASTTPSNVNAITTVQPPTPTTDFQII
uniref:G-protein coupled receptors family 1 profile domain-containing protein n=1 Tax=Panagrellus redivivus TaxID=6233 RepID=A0A7E4URN4_PANRE